jgi:sigma-B regulation protein RsbU (phosphoserine phosphatase)
MTAASPAGSRILVVDDVEMNRDVLTRRLKREGFEVVCAENGRAALEVLAASPFDLVLLDLMMPEMDGHETLTRMKADENLARIPVVMISANEEIDAIVRCIELGAEDYLGKPFNPAILRARVRSSLERKQLRDRERLYTESLAREMAIGRQIQAGFLPETIPSVAGWEVAALFEPARQCAGDFYDVVETGGGRLFLTVGDVCDKGVGAALFMALFRSLLRAFATEFVAGESPEDLLTRTVTRTNAYIAATHGSANMFATVFAAVLDPGSGDLVWINGGQEAPLILSGGAVSERLTKTGPAVGMLSDVSFAVRRSKLSPGDLLLAFTDGVTEAKGPGGFLGEDRLAAAALARDGSAAGVVEAVQIAIAEQSAGCEQFDDIALLAVRRIPAA